VTVQVHSVKNHRLPVLLAVVFAGALAWGWTTFGPQPYFFVESGLSVNRGDDLNPADAARCYFRDHLVEAGVNPTEIKSERWTISVSSRTSDQAIVNVLEPCEDDSVYLIYNRFTLNRTKDLWRVVRHQSAWQGRGRLGWTTRPTS
jgi:hypothetical protein